MDHVPAAVAAPPGSPLESLVRTRAQLAVIDVQEAFRTRMAAFAAVERRCAFLVRVARALAVPVVACEQNPARLGPSAAALREALGAYAPTPKMSFDATAEPAFADRLAADRTIVIVAGIEAHVCVLQTVLGLLRGGRTVFLVLDAIGSQRPRDLDVAVRRALGAGAIPATTESVAFELLGTASDPRFRDVLPLITAELAADGVREPAASPLAVEDGDP